jgi:hypothetical protein
MGLNSDIKEILELNQRSSSSKSEAFEKLKGLQEKIKSGDSTGDKIRDFVIVNLGTLSPDNEKPYRETEARLKDGIGNQILVVEQKESTHGCRGFFPPRSIDPMFIGIDTELRLGVLTSGLELDIGEGKIILPTERHARKYGLEYSINKWELKEGPISLGPWVFMNLGKEVQKRMTPMPNDLSTPFEHGLMLHLGEEVEQYFSRNRSLLDNKCILDTSYVDALNLLGLEIPERFKKKYDENVYQERVGIINKLEELTGRESKLNAEIKSIHGRIDKRPSLGGRVLYSTGPDLPGLSEDDARVVSTGPRMKLKETKEEIQGYLGEAIELGMHKGDLRIKQKPGMEINVSDYICGMCEKYQIELPK